jgi:hypothetical protein
MIIDTDQIVSFTEAAKIKGIPENLLAYYLKKPGAPQAIPVLGRKAYMRQEIEVWNPVKTNKEETQ